MSGKLRILMLSIKQKATTAKKNLSVVFIRLSKPIKMSAIILGEFFRSLYI
jgi:hypothetical protein